MWSGSHAWNSGPGIGSIPGPELGPGIGSRRQVSGRSPGGLRNRIPGPESGPGEVESLRALFSDSGTFFRFPTQFDPECQKSGFRASEPKNRSPAPKLGLGPRIGSFGSGNQLSDFGNQLSQNLSFRSKFINRGTNFINRGTNFYKSGSRMTKLSTESEIYKFINL